MYTQRHSFLVARTISGQHIEIQHRSRQGDMLGVAKFISESLDVMLGADSDNQSQASDQPRWLEVMSL